MCISGHAQVGGAALVAALGLGTSHVAPSKMLAAAPQAPHALAQQFGSELAFTGPGHIALLLIVASLLIVVGFLMVGLVRRHGTDRGSGLVS
jgi:hypothetical protein